MIKDAARESLARIMDEQSESFVALARASGLDPATGWRGADLRSVCSAPQPSGQFYTWFCTPVRK